MAGFSGDELRTLSTLLDLDLARKPFAEPGGGPLTDPWGWWLAALAGDCVLLVPPVREFEKERGIGLACSACSALALWIYFGDHCFSLEGGLR